MGAARHQHRRPAGLDSINAANWAAPEPRILCTHVLYRLAERRQGNAIRAHLVER